MKKMNENGLAAVGIVAVVVLAGLIGAAGWFIYDKQTAMPENTQVPAAYASATDSTGRFSYEYPTDWTIEPYNWEESYGGPLREEPDWSKQSKPIKLYPSENKNAAVTITMEDYGIYWASYDDLKARVNEDYFAKILFDGIRDDGHKALFSRVDYLGPPDAKVESFTDHRYYFDNGTSVLKIEFREKYHHDWPDDETGPDINHSQYLADFEHIAKSVRFSN